MMITESEYVAIKAFDKTLDRNTQHANGIIARKNSEIESAARIIAHLRAELAASQSREASLRKQIANVLN